MIETADQALITRVLDGFAAENDAMMNQLYDIWYFWRGGMSRDDIWAMSPIEREQAAKFLNRRFKEIGEITKKGGQAFY